MTIYGLYSHWPSRLVLAVLDWERFISCTVINHFHYRSPHAFDSRGNKRKTKPQRVFMMEHAAYVYLYFKPCSRALFVRVNAQVFWLITPLLYHFSPSPRIYALPQQLLCSLSQLSLLPLSISLARSINTKTNLAVSLKGDFLHSGAPLQAHSSDVATVQNKVMYISLLFSYTARGEAVLNEYCQRNILKMSGGARQPHRS